MLVSRHWVRSGSSFCLRRVLFLFLDNWRVSGSLFHNTLTYSLLGMQEVHLKENWRKYRSWYQTSWRSMHTSDRGGRDCDGRDTNSLAADAASSTSERVERIERTESGGQKESKMQQKYLNVISDDLWCVREKLCEKTSSKLGTVDTTRHDTTLTLVIRRDR